MSKTDPEHYRQSDIEPIDVIEAWGLGFHLGNVIKYIARAKHKGDEEGDLAKALWYLQRHLGLDPDDADYYEVQLSQAHWKIESLRMELNQALAREQLREEGIDVNKLDWGDDNDIDDDESRGEWVGDKEYWEAPQSNQYVVSPDDVGLPEPGFPRTWPWLNPTD